MQELKLNYDKLQRDSEIALENERRTVALLVSEKAHLTAEVKKLEEAELSAGIYFRVIKFTDFRFRGSESR